MKLKMLRTATLQIQMAPSSLLSGKGSFFFRNHRRPALQVRAQSFRDEGRSSFNNIVDANLSVLRERIAEVTMKEKLERRYKRPYGWTYAAGYDCKLKRQAEKSEFLHLAGLVAGTIGFTCLSGTIFLCLISFFLHFNPY